VFNGVSFKEIENELKKAYIKNPVVKVSESSWTEAEKQEFKTKHGRDIPKKWHNRKGNSLRWSHRRTVLERCHNRHHVYAKTQPLG